MQSIQIDGTFTYASNIKNLKIGDQIKLIPNPNNRINSGAIGAYTITGSKIGYVPFKSNQIDIKAKYTVSKINLTQENPILLISREFEQSNIIPVFPKYLKSTNKENYSEELKDFAKYLVKAGNEINEIKIIYQDENFINLLIKTPDDEFIFYTVTKKYYEENIFIYDEFYKFKLTPKCIFQPFQIHRLEMYLQTKYKPIDKLLKKKKLNELNITNIEKIDGLKSLAKSDITGLVYNQEQLDILIKLIIQYDINKNEYYNPGNYLKTIHSTITYSVKPKLDNFKDLFNDVKVGGLCYNHFLKYYCSVDLYDDNNIIEIWTGKIVNKEKLTELLIKLFISNKQFINLYNPIEGTLDKIEIDDLLKNIILNIISK